MIEEPEILLKPMQFVAAVNGCNMPAAVHPRTHEQHPHPGLRESLNSAIREIKFLSYQNSSLMTENAELNTKLQQQERVLTSRQVEVSRRQEKLIHHEYMLMKAVWKRKFNTKDRVDTLDQPAQKEQKLKRTSCDPPEDDHVSNSTQLQRKCSWMELETWFSNSPQLQELNTKLQEQEQVLTARQVEVRRLQEELQEKTDLLDRETERRMVRYDARMKTLKKLTRIEAKLNRVEEMWKSKCDALEQKHVSNSTQLQELNTKLQQQEHVLTARQVEMTRLQEELREKTGLLDREIQKRLDKYEAHTKILQKPTRKETELNRAEEQRKSKCDAPEENHVTNSTQLQELNTTMQEQVLEARQVEVTHLQEKLNPKENILMKAIWKKRFNAKDHVYSLDQSAQTEQEPKRTRCDSPEDNHVTNSTQLQEVTKCAAKEE